jgi:hypothetical protein
VARAETKALDEIYDCVDQGPLSEDWGSIPDSRDATASLSRHALLTAVISSATHLGAPRDFDSASEKNAKLLLGTSATREK